MTPQLAALQIKRNRGGSLVVCGTAIEYERDGQGYYLINDRKLDSDSTEEEILDVVETIIRLTPPLIKQ